MRFLAAGPTGCTIPSQACQQLTSSLQTGGWNKAVKKKRTLELQGFLELCFFYLEGHMPIISTVKYILLLTDFTYIITKYCYKWKGKDWFRHLMLQPLWFTRVLLVASVTTPSGPRKDIKSGNYEFKLKIRSHSKRAWLVANRFTHSLMKLWDLELQISLWYCSVCVSIEGEFFSNKCMPLGSYYNYRLILVCNFSGDIWQSSS